jgi:NADPH:quinone reductase-like Zn-dependent oxidoreductase
MSRRAQRHVVGFVSEHPVETKGEDVEILVRLVARGRLRPLIGRVEDWTRTPTTMLALTAREFRGKAVLLRT